LYITTSRHDRRPFPRGYHYFPTMEEVILRTTRDTGIILMGYVLMPNHLHLIAGSSEGGKAISVFIHSVKGRIRETLQGKGKFWQDRFDDFLLKSEKQFGIKLNYIHYNPVRARLVQRPEDWQYSSYTDWRDRKTEKGIRFDFDWM
jgi:putative transposase